MLDIFVTNVPIDPGVRRVLLGEVVTAQLALVKEELDVVRHSETLAKGVVDSTRASALETRLQVLEGEQTNLGPSIERPTNAARLAHLFNEVFSFVDDVLSEKATKSLMTALEKDSNNALAREDAFQMSSMAFVQRLSAYTDLDDLSQPIAAAVLCAKFGIRCIARGLELAHTSVPSALAPIVSFPTVASLPTLQALPMLDKAEPSPSSIRLDLLATLAYARDATDSEQRMAHVPGLVAGLDRLYAAWSFIRTREAQEAADAESLYRIRKTDIEILSDEELMEKEFAELFPIFDGDEIMEDNVPEKVQDEAEHEDKRKAKFMGDKITAFHSLILASFGKGSVHDTLKTAVDDVLTTFSPTAFREDLDGKSLAFQVSTLHRRNAEIKTSAAQANFYFAPNEFEVRKAWTLLERLRNRLDALVTEWPDQMVLVHLRERVLRILNLDVRSPVAKVLAVLEQLLLHTDDWEPYANRDNSLKNFQLDISNLIVAWRRLELASWVRLLDDQVALYTAGDDEFTLRLYGALIHGTVSAEDVDAYLETALPVVSTYINGSTLGQFEHRLAVLAAFQRMAEELGLSDEPHAAGIAKVGSILRNLIAHAKLYLPRASDSLASQRKIIDGGVKDFVKLASWKDINVFALKASAQKSHKQLHKHIRKFKEVLMQPMAPIFMDSGSICPQDAASSPSAQRTGMFDITALPADAVTVRAGAKPAVPNVLVKLNDTLTRYTNVHTRAREVVSSSEASALEGLSVDIIETAAMLLKATPTFLTKDNTKIVNNLAGRKRKAFSDLLKTLRACGFSQAVPADQMARQQSVSWLSRRPALKSDDLPVAFDTAAVTKVSDYHHRNSVLMTALRASFNGHSPDIASQDLGRGIGFCENLYAAALGEHTRLASQLDVLNRLTSTLRRLHHCALSESLSGGDKLHQALSAAELDAYHLREALKEVEDGVRAFRELQGAHVGTADLASVHEARQEVSLLITALETALSSSRSAGWSLFGHDEASLVGRAHGIFKHTSTAAEQRANATPELAHLFTPLANMAAGMGSDVPLRGVRTLSDGVWNESDALIQALLVAAQGIDTTKPEEIKDDDYPVIPAAFLKQAKAVASLRVSAVVDRLDKFASAISVELAGRESSLAPAALARVLPFVETLAETYAESVAAHVASSKSMYKLNYVVSRVMLDIATKGFCKPQEESKDDSKDGDDQGTAEGTGMGAGTGDKNVSNEIKDESQVEGLQGEEEEEQDKEEGGDDNEDDDDAFSMENDFDGALEDGKEKDEEDKDGDDDDENKDDELDDHVGDVDPLDPGAVDEKFWGDEEKEEEEQKEDREDLMNEKTQDNGESELAAKDGAKEDKKKQKEDGDDAQEQEQEQEAQDNQDDGKKPEDTQHDDNQEDGDDEMDEFEEQGEDDGENEGPDMPQQDNVAAPEGDKLDLPEDLDLGGDDDDDDGAAEDNDEQFDDPDIDMEQDDNMPEDHGVTSDHEGAEEDEKDAPDATGATEEDADPEQEESANQNLDTSASNDATAQEAAAAGRGQGSANKEDAGEDEMMEGEDGEEGVDEQEEDEQADADGAASSAPQGGGGPDEQEASGPADQSGAPLPNDTQTLQQDRKLGDIMEEIKRRRDEILNQTEREEVTDNADASEQAPGQVEYLQDGQEDEDDSMQALGPARDEQQKLEDLKIVDDEQEGEDAPPPAMEDNGEDKEDVPANMPPPHETESLHREKNDTADSMGAEKALTQSDIVGNAPVSGDAMDVDEDGEGEVPATESKPDEGDDEDVDLTIADPAAVVDDADGAEDLWRQYASLTSDLSYALCEQLRLILEPTLATRLQGDFRTGKRLNMRKIIPYIASEYTKDKIWLRRTKPSRREYQVLLSLDDSRSMAESHSVHLAYQTLALVSQALTKLEVGQVSIARFGESVDILHEFGETFSDQDGANVMRAFKFDQHRTDVAALVERTLAYLAESRHKNASQSAPDLWQLQIIISDGVCQDHAKLRTLLRRAIEERVMIVFLIVDSLAVPPTNPTTPAPASASAPASAPVSAPGSGAVTPVVPQTRPSILSMQSVNYSMVNGEMKLEMTRYLDTFPFEFYVVLRDVEALPGVLSDTLRQWMTRVSQSNE